MGAGRKFKLANQPTVVKRIPEILVPMVDKIILEMQESKLNFALQKYRNIPENALIPIISDHPVPIPFFSDKVSAGFPSPAEGYMENHIDLNEYLISNKAATFIVRAGGDSMHDAGIDKEDMLIVDRSLEPRHLDIVMADFNNEFTIKRLHLIHHQLELHPENKKVSYSVLRPSDSDTLSIVGVIVAVIKVFKPVSK